MDANELIERVMTEHWDMAACPCTFCVEARKLGLRPRDCYPTNPKVSILEAAMQAVSAAEREG